MSLTANEARDLARRFHELANALGSYRFDNWNGLKPAERQKLESDEWTLLNQSVDLVNYAIGITLDDAEANLAELAKATGRAKNAIKKIKTVRRVIEIGTAAVVFGAAIISRSPSAIGTALGKLNDATSPPKKKDAKKVEE